MREKIPNFTERLISTIYNETNHTAYRRPYGRNASLSDTNTGEVGRTGTDTQGQSDTKPVGVHGKNELTARERIRRAFSNERTYPPAEAKSNLSEDRVEYKRPRSTEFTGVSETMQECERKLLPEAARKLEDKGTSSLTEKQHSDLTNT